MSLDFDIRRSMILSEYLKYWGLPESRRTFSVGEENIELYVFSGEDMDQVTRFATVGLSASTFSNAKKCENELLLVVPFDVGLDQLDVIHDYIVAISGYIINSLDCDIKSEDVLAKTDFAPADWPPALLFDEPRGEPEAVRHFNIGMQPVALSWVVPIFTSEYELIKNNGIDAFDTAIDNVGVSLVEVRRHPACS